MNLLIKKRILISYIIMIVAFGMLFAKLAYVKIDKGTEYYKRALDLWTRSAPIEGRRGNIYDRNGNLIVGSKLTPTLVAIPKQVKDKKAAAQSIAKIVGCSTEKIWQHLNKSVSVEILKPEAQKITVEMAMEIAKLDLDGIYIVGDSSRYYPYPTCLAQVIGIVGIDNQGISGIEYIYDNYLKGKKGALQIFTDAHGDSIDDFSGHYDSASSGFDLYLTIDLNIQLTLERVMENAYVRYTPNDVVGLVLNPKTSEVLAMASRPTFDLEHYQDYAQEIYNRNLPIWKSYEPGSTFKICTFSAGLEEKVFTLEETFHDPGYMVIDGTRIRDWKKGGHGTETFLQVLENSCNPGFMTIGLRLGKEKLFEYIRNFGYGSKTGIDLLGESAGILFRTDQIGNVELATASFGQGNAATPLQILNAACAAVNGGNLYQPYILKAIGSGSVMQVEKEPTLIRQVISKETSQKVAYALESVVAKGTGRTSFLSGYRVGGKTGTAQIAENGHYVDGKYILSYLGIAPMDDPSVAVYMAIENPHNAIQYGGTTVGPLVREVLSESLSFLKVKKRTDEIPYEARLWIDKKIYKVQDYTGVAIKDIQRTSNYQIVIQGNGHMVLSQMPEAGESIIEGGTVILYT